MSEDRSIDPAMEHTSDPVGEPSFLRRWSERKARARQADLTPGERPPPAPAAPVPELTDADMPPLDALDEHSDYSLFFSPRVSEALRRAALRQLFHSPACNVIDPLCDYREDFTGFAALGEVMTQDWRHRLDVEARRLAAAVPTAEPPATPGRTAVAARDSAPAGAQAPVDGALTTPGARLA